jgi:hypothetical protein
MSLSDHYDAEIQLKPFVAETVPVPFPVRSCPIEYWREDQNLRAFSRIQTGVKNIIVIVQITNRLQIDAQYCVLRSRHS